MERTNGLRILFPASSLITKLSFLVLYKYIHKHTHSSAHSSLYSFNIALFMEHLFYVSHYDSRITALKRVGPTQVLTMLKV